MHFAQLRRFHLKTETESILRNVLGPLTTSSTEDAAGGGVFALEKGGQDVKLTSL
jgi:hypothetical protein